MKIKKLTWTSHKEIDGKWWYGSLNDIDYFSIWYPTHPEKNIEMNLHELFEFVHCFNTPPVATLPQIKKIAQNIFNDYVKSLIE